MTMAVKSPIASALNPNAPLFVPAAYLAAEDFSPEWWSLVQTCPAFRDYWMRERFDCFEEEDTFDADLHEFDEIDEFMDLQENLLEMEAAQHSLHFSDDNGVRSEDDEGLNANNCKELKKQQASLFEPPLRYHDKIPSKAASSPRKGAIRRIQQPRNNV